MAIDSTSSENKNDKRAKEKAEAESAAALIRQKLDNLYDQEPSAQAEAQEVINASRPRSKHQQFMYELSQSGKSIAETQTAWHDYYQQLPEKEKQEVWDEFYSANSNIKGHQSVTQSAVHHTGQQPSSHSQHTAHKHLAKRRTVTQLKKQLLTPASHPKRKLKARHHFQSLIFGLGLGSLVMLLMLFGFFNERFIAPFVTPSRQVSSTPIIAGPDSLSVSPDPEIIIPKINVEMPVVYDEPSIEEKAVQTALERGVLHYATTPSPGEKGNVVIFGHSSNNIFNPGKYKFAFVLLSRLENGDTFYLTKNSKLYAYRIYKKQVVSPEEVGVLASADKSDTATLITCDPPGTTLKRLVVTGEQISPDPNANTASTAVSSNNKPAFIPSNAPSLWQKIKDWFSS